MKNSLFDITAIGSATVDNFLKAKYRLVPDKDVPSGRAILLPFGDKIEIDDFYPTIGGNSANASVTFARQGFKAACLAKVGDDLSGRELKERLEKENVDTGLMARAKEKNTAFSALLLTGGERTILSYHGASDLLKNSDIQWDKIKSSWWYLSLAGESDALYPDFIKFAKDNGIKVAFNPSGHHIRHKRQEILDSLADLAFLVLNKGEAAELLGISFKDEKKVFTELDDVMPGILAITDGPNGVAVSDGKNVYRAGTFKEKIVADRTGAGDAFGSGFVSGLMRAGRDLSDITPENIKFAIRLASANATSVVEQVGATEGILSEKEFDGDKRWKELEINVEHL